MRFVINTPLKKNSSATTGTNKITGSLGKSLQHKMQGLQEPIEGWFAAFQLLGWEERWGGARTTIFQQFQTKVRGISLTAHCALALCFPTVVKTLPLSSSITAVKQARGGPAFPELNSDLLCHKRADLVLLFEGSKFAVKSCVYLRRIQCHVN